MKIALAITPPKEPIYDFGSLCSKDPKDPINLRPHFPGKKFIGTDFRPGPGVDLVLDLHKINLPSSSVHTALCMDTFEHVEYPHKAIDELFRILSPQGMLILVTVMNWGIHNHPSDYYRFTPNALRSLAKQFPFSQVEQHPLAAHPQTVALLALKYIPPPPIVQKLKTSLPDFSKPHS